MFNVNDYIQWSRREKHTVWGQRVEYTVRVVDQRHNNPAAILNKLSAWGDCRPRNDQVTVTLLPESDKKFFHMLEAWAGDMQRHNEMFSDETT